MPVHLGTKDPGFERAFAVFLAAKRETSPDVDAAVREIIEAVRRDGDAALIAFTQRFDGFDLAATGLRVNEAEIAGAVAASDQEALAALKLALGRIESHHRRQLPRDDRYTDALGAELGWRWTAVDSVGLYVPGGLASYPSSVLMNVVPAKVAGVPHVVMAVPAPGGKINPLVLAAAHLAGISEIYRIGGAQAIAALAYGTESIKPVVRSSGPAMLTLRRQSARCSARWASTRSPGHPKCWWSRTSTTTPNGSPPICWPRPSTTPRRKPLS